MEIGKDIPAPIEQLLPIEEIFYYIYQNNLVLEEFLQNIPQDFQHMLDHNEQINTMFSGIITSITDTNLSEKLFFDEKFDINVNVHPRYYPSNLHFHEFYEIQYILNGSCYQNVNNTKIFLRKGDICFIAPNTPHDLEVYSKETIVINILVRNSTFRSTFGSLIGKNDIISEFFTRSLYKPDASPYILCKTNAEPEYERLIRLFFSESKQKTKYSKRYMNCLLELFFIEILRYHEYHFVIAESTKNIENEIMPAILSYIQDNFKSITLIEVAKHFNYSEAHLSRIIKKFTGQTFSNILKQIRVKYAADLIKESNMPINDIVFECGYTDISHFYRTFKQHYKMTPAEYKRELDNK